MIRSNETNRPSRKEGFTMIELVAVIAIGSVLMSIAIRGFGTVTSRFAAQNARQSFMAMQARARAHAIERGDLVRLRVDPATDEVSIVTTGVQIELVDFGVERDVDIETSTTGTIELCMNARGFGDITCNSFGGSTVTVDFGQGAQTSSVTILPLGQLQW